MKFKRVVVWILLLILIALSLEILVDRWVYGLIPTQVSALTVFATLLANGALAAFYLHSTARPGS